MKTPAEIKIQIEALKKVRPKVRPYSVFGTDNLVQLDAQIDVLENNLDSTDIFDKYGHSGIDEEVVPAALEARQWIDGDSEFDDLASGYPLEE
ncbi:MAG TPA: hypothetical protein VMW50_08260 [Dehalococcoidia bacterium]|nr:hypothetical protein [Dehalococcoidia bacterium]